MQRWPWVVCVALGACREPVHEHVDARLVRADVLAAVVPVLGRKEYVLTEPDDVDPCIADAMTRADDRAGVIWNARMCIEDKFREPAR